MFGPSLTFPVSTCFTTYSFCLLSFMPQQRFQRDKPTHSDTSFFVSHIQILQNAIDFLVLFQRSAFIVVASFLHSFPEECGRGFSPANSGISHQEHPLSCPHELASCLHFSMSCHLWPGSVLKYSCCFAE